MKKTKSVFRGKVKTDVARQEKANAGSSYLMLPKNFPTYSPTPGAKEKIDILPYNVKESKHPDRNEELEIAVKGGLWYKRPFYVHREVGTDKDRVICLKSFGEKCPICDYRVQRAKQGADKDELKAYNNSLRNLYFVIPRGVKKLEETPHIFDMSQHLFQNLLNEEVNENEDYEAFPDVEEGLTLQIRWNEETFQNNKYADAGRIDFKPRAEAIDEDTVSELPDLGSLLKKLKYEDMKKMFLEVEDTDDDDDEPAKPTKTAPKKPVVETDDDDDDEQESTHKIRPINPPKKSSKPSSKKPVVETDYDDEPAVIIEWDDLSVMDSDELIEVIEHYKLDIDVDDFDDALELTKAIAEELNIEIPSPKKKETKTAPKKPVVEDTDDDTDEPEKPTKKSLKPEPKKETPGESSKCPHSHKFGVDTDTFDECDDCKLWNACIDVKESKG